MKLQKICVLRPLKLGDFLVTTPALRALRAAFPDAQIDYVGLPWMEEIVPRYSDYIDNFIEFPGYPGLPEREYKPRAVVDFLRTIQDKSYDLVLQMVGNGRIVNTVVPLFGAAITAGFASEQGYWPNRQYFMEYPEHRPEVLKLLDLLEFLGIRSQIPALEFPLSDNDAVSLQKKVDLSGTEYICVHPGSVSGARWPAASFAAVADRLAARGYTVVLTGSTNEADLTQQVAQYMQADAIDLAGKTNIGELGALLRGSALLLSNDTGVAHLANALDVPSVTIFTTADPERWHALGQKLHPYVTLERAKPALVTDMALSLVKGAMLV